jgi:hypothetical protein
MAASRSLAVLLACLLCTRALGQGTPSFVSDTQAGTAPTLVTADESTGKVSRWGALLAACPEHSRTRPPAARLRLHAGRDHAAPLLLPRSSSQDLEDQGFGLANSYMSPAGEHPRRPPGCCPSCRCAVPGDRAALPCLEWARPVTCTALICDLA